MKGSVDNVTALSDSLSFKASQMRSLFVAMNGKLQDIDSFSADLTRMFRIENTTVIENLLHFAHGDCSNLEQLAHTHSKHFQLVRPRVA